MPLSTEQVEEFKKDGYLVIKDFATPEEIELMNKRAVELLHSFDPSTLESVFSTKNQSATTDTYFLESASSIAYFWEEKAKDTNGNLIKPKEECINKIGHALHDLDPVFSLWSKSHKLIGVAKSLGFHQPIPAQSMLIFKQPGIGGEVVPHQDSTFLATEPPSVVGMWLALEDATQDNGCLWTLPGSHKFGVKRRFIRRPDNSCLFEGEQDSYDLDEFVPVEVAAGSLVLLHGACVHYSKENLSNKSRHAYTLHIVEGNECKYLETNWLQRPAEMPFVPLYGN